MKKLTVSLLVLFLSAGGMANERATLRYFDKIRDEPTLLRSFLYQFPKGGDLHNHLDGAVYAENYIEWAAEDGKCVDLQSFMISVPPCNSETGRPPLKAIQHDFSKVNQVIDALSVRNYERRGLSGHQQFFSTFRRFLPASFGREGYMLAEVSARAARQNIVYLELMQSWGMAEARALARDNTAFSEDLPLPMVVSNPALDRLVDLVVEKLDANERQWREQLACGTDRAAPGCAVPVRYLAQVIRVFPRDQVLAQTVLAFKLVQRDPRYVGLNFVAPEDHPVSLRDYRWQMQTIGKLGEFFPSVKAGITLHAGEVELGLVPPEHLGWHIREAIEVAGARRIGHGIDIYHDPTARQLMSYMAEQGIMVEINLTSNDVILGVEGERHPFHLYRNSRVPMAFSTDDEGVSRIDLSHEYQRAVETFDLGYTELKHYSRNALVYSFLPGESLVDYRRRDHFVEACAGARPGQKPAAAQCREFLDNSEKARSQWDLEARFHRFEAAF